MEIKTLKKGGITILEIKGRLDSVIANSLEHERNSQIESNNRWILLKFS